MTDELLESGGRSLKLQRVPPTVDLRAFDQADLYALDHLREMFDGDAPDRILLVLDAFGALACALADRARVSAGDSELARLALRANEEANGIESECVWTSLDHIEGEFDLAIVKIPREKGLLDAALSRIRPHLADGAAVLGAGMTRHIHNSTSAAFERWIGPAHTSRARSRARLVHATATVSAGTVPPAQSVPLPGEDFKLWLEPGVFARQGVDIGSGLLLPHIPRLRDEGRHQTIVDPGCGSGLLAAVAARRNPQAIIVGTDSSYLAVASARKTFLEASLENAEARVDNVMATVGDRSVDLVLSNPPQHQAATLNQDLLARFIADAARVLRPKGQVRMVANRHVNLNLALRESFDRIRILDQDRQFMVCEADAPV